MGRSGVEHAKRFGLTLPEFPSLLEARKGLLAKRDNCLGMFREMAERQDIFTADYSVDSLGYLDDLYATLHRTDSFEKFCRDRAQFEECMAMYFGEVVVRNKGAQWIVEEFTFVKGRYQIGIRRDKLTWMLDRFTDYFESLQRKRHPMIKKYQEF